MEILIHAHNSSINISISHKHGFGIRPDHNLPKSNQPLGQHLGDYNLLKKPRPTKPSITNPRIYLNIRDSNEPALNSPGDGDEFLSIRARSALHD